MFFVLSKTLAVLLEPLAHPYILLCIAALARLLGLGHDCAVHVAEKANKELLASRQR